MGHPRAEQDPDPAHRWEHHDPSGQPTPTPWASRFQCSLNQLDLGWGLPSRQLAAMVHHQPVLGRRAPHPLWLFACIHPYMPCTNAMVHERNNYHN